MRRCFSFFAFMGFACFFVPALAGQAPAPARVRSVEGTPFCRAESAYPDGRRIAFIYAGPTTTEGLSLELGIPGGRFKQGRRYDLEVALEGKASRRLRVEALTEESLLFDFGTSAFWATGLENANALRVGSAEKTLVFDLPPMRPLFEALRLCVAGQEAQKTTFAQKEKEEAFPDGLRDFLAQAGFSAVKPIALTDVPEEERAADFVWETGNVFGGLRTVSVPEGSSFAELVGLHLKGLKEKCAGAFRATLGKERAAPFALLRPAEVVCAAQTKGDSVFVSLLFAFSPKGALSVFTHEGLEKYKAEVTAARDMLGAFLLRQAPFENEF